MGTGPVTNCLSQSLTDLGHVALGEVAADSAGELKLLGTW